MKYADALKKSEKCIHAVAVPVLRIGPSASEDCVVMCKLKVRRGEACDECDGDSNGNCTEKK